ncbi:histone-lysine N-methyltransferase PRDM9-like isoform X4 [Centropristis striata]|uniref:histone-lysine N-methyltransferase PRDM9-like isoform X4 n=1 Tax=Centropristis striata TaxID=184440 RepID=UPI0027E086D1|nr:histone-lysine N-methyltransferase PRDM9-like isoform X4 [Centropristis striata]
MSAVEYLRQFVSQRLTAAAEEIFGVFEKTVIEYEEEIDRQRKLLDIVWKPDIKLHRIELQQQHVCQEEEVLADQQLCIEERNSSLDQEDPDPPQIKEEQQELYISQEGEQPALKQETDTLLLTPTDEESDHSEDQTVSFSIKRHHNNTSHSINVNNPELSEFRHKTHTGKKSVRCDRCGKYFRCNAILKEHMTTHTGEKPYLCKTCGKRFSRLSSLTRHTRTHIGMDPCICKTCGKDFLTGNILAFHMRTAHTGAGAKSKKNLAVRGREVRNLACNWRVAGSNPELPQQHVCKEEEVVADQQLCIEERNSSLDQEDPDPPQIKEEQQELCTSQEGEQPALKQVTYTLLLTPTPTQDRWLQK